jgi:hypothetical protein
MTTLVATSSWKKKLTGIKQAVQAKLSMQNKDPSIEDPWPQSGERDPQYDGDGNLITSSGGF